MSVTARTSRVKRILSEVHRNREIYIQTFTMPYAIPALA
jgi:hypothetical protein